MPTPLFGPDHPLRWQIVNDDVMGGVSRSRIELDPAGMLKFSGIVSLENNGGFASVRSEPRRFALAGCDALRVRLRGDGQRYKLTVRMGAGWDTPVYQASFATQRDEWRDIEFPLAQFVPTFRGRRLTDEPPLDPDRIQSVGFLISDQQAGPFRLEVASIIAVKQARKEAPAR